MPVRLVRRLSYLEAHHRAFVCSGCAALGFLCGAHLPLPMRFIVGWDAYAMSFLFLAWVPILTARPATVVRVAKKEHSSGKIIFAFVLGAACVSLGAVGYLLGTARDLPAPARTGHVFVAMATVVSSWSVVHTLFTLQYAFFYYRNTHSKKPAGLQFPGETKPDYLDFAYFAFVIGMTSQVSDVAIDARQIRRWALLHGMISFAFNAAILALSINLISGLF